MATSMRKVTAAALAILLFGATATIAAQRISRVEARSSDTWTVNVTRGELVTIIVDGDGDTDLNLFVRQGGVLLDKDDDTTDYCVVAIEAQYTGRLSVEVKNLGFVWNGYRLTVLR